MNRTLKIDLYIRNGFLTELGLCAKELVPCTEPSVTYLKEVKDPTLV